MSNEARANNLGLKVFAEQINIALFNDVIAFVMATTSANTTEVYRKLCRTHLWYSKSDNDNIQAQYGFRYFGELLERFEDKAGSDIKDMRAIALAMAYSKDLLTDNMFVGNQKASFISKIKRLSVNDTYLKGALYLLLRNGSGNDTLLEILSRVVYTRTEEIVFVLSLYDDFERGFVILKAQLLKLLGAARTIGLIENSLLYTWLVRELCCSENIKNIRSKDMALFRAFIDIHSVFVKPGSRHHNALIANAYTDEEILFLNSFIIRHRPSHRTINSNSITAEKIAVEMMVTFINSEKFHPPEAFEQMEYLLEKYARFEIKISGYIGIYEAIEHRILMQNPQTFVWMHHKFAHKRIFYFDILDKKWDALSKDLKPDEYRNIFDYQLMQNAGETSEMLRERLSRYEELSGMSYIEALRLEHEYARDAVFSLLVNKGIIDLNSLFTDCLCIETELKAGEHNARRSILTYFRCYLEGIHTRQAFDFFKAFFKEYDFEDLNRFFTIEAGYNGYNSRNYFINELYINRSGYYNNGMKEIKIKRSFLSEEEQRELFGWLDEFMYQYNADGYTEFAVYMLLDDFITSLFPHDELRKIYEMVRGLDNSHVKNNENALKMKFLTADELQAEEDAVKAKKEKAKQDEAKRRIQELRDKLEETFDGSCKSLLKFMETYRYSYEAKTSAIKIAHEYLPVVLDKNDNRYSMKEFGYFLQLCGKLVRKGFLSFSDVKNYISVIGEVEEIAEDN